MEDILQEKILYHIKKYKAYSSQLTLNKQSLILEDIKPPVPMAGIVGGILGMLIGKFLVDKLIKKHKGFELNIKDIIAIENIKIGLNKKVIQITDKSSNEYKMTVKNPQQWIDEILLAKRNA
tara:strand:- start:915 stop:1280 length:366 start_codon:yes stop_codon:yes gene_type:complete